MLRSSLCLLLAGAFTLSCVFATDVESDTITDWSPVSVQLTEQERVCFEMINSLRARSGLSPFVLCPDLTAQSRSWSANLQSRGYLYHGAAPEICAQTNIQCGERAFNLWYNSPAHRAFLYKSNTTVGIGNVGNFWTMRGASAVQERSSGSVRQDGGSPLSASGFFYVPSGESLSDFLSAERRSADTVEQTAPSDTPSVVRDRVSVSRSVDGFYFVPSGESLSDFLSAEAERRSADAVEQTVPSATQNIYRPRLGRTSVFRFR